MRILLVEDEKRLSDVLKKGLLEQGFAVDQAFDGEEGLFLAQSESYDLVILDVMLPRVSGVEVCKKLRQENINVPILMLTAKANTEDKVLGLNAGADDYLTKPFEFSELKARVNALLRRNQRQFETTIVIGDLEIDPAKHNITRGGKDVLLTPKEFSILEFMARHKGEVVTRTQIMEHTWDYNFDSLSNVVDVFIASIRKKVDGGQKVKLIHTVHGVGYSISSK